MPVTQTKQARVDLAEKQYAVIAEMMQAASRVRQPMFSIEETNIEGTVVVITRRGMTLVDGQGNASDIGNAGAVSEMARGA